MGLGRKLRNFIIVISGLARFVAIDSLVAQVQDYPIKSYEEYVDKHFEEDRDYIRSIKDKIIDKVMLPSKATDEGNVYELTLKAKWHIEIEYFFVDNTYNIFLQDYLNGAFYYDREANGFIDWVKLMDETSDQRGDWANNVPWSGNYRMGNGWKKAVETHIRYMGTLEKVKNFLDQ